MADRLPPIIRFFDGDHELTEREFVYKHAADWVQQCLVRPVTYDLFHVLRHGKIG